MDQSSSIGNLSAALAKAQLVMANPHFDAVNPHFKSKFASLVAVRESVIPVLCAQGIALTQWPISNGEAAGCRTVLSCGDEWMAENFLIPVDKHNAHGYASAVTYAKRIAMQSVAGVVGEADDDGNGAVGDNVKGEKKIAGETTGKGLAKISPTTDVFESLPIDQQNRLLDIASRVSSLLKKGDVSGAYAELKEDYLDAREDLKVALWSRFDSKERRALGDYGDTQRNTNRGANAQEKAAA